VSKNGLKMLKRYDVKHDVNHTISIRDRNSESKRINRLSFSVFLCLFFSISAISDSYFFPFPSLSICLHCEKNKATWCDWNEPSLMSEKNGYIGSYISYL